MNRMIVVTFALAAVVGAPLLANAQTDSHGWLNNETLQSRYGTFEFKNGYPVGDAAARLLDMQKLNRAVEVYTTQMMRVSEIALRVVYDTLSRSELQNGQALPSLSSYVNPKLNADGSLDILFGPNAPQSGGNWTKTVAGKGWFPIFRFYSPTEAFFDKTWTLNDIEVMQLDRPRRVSPVGP